MGGMATKILDRELSAFDRELPGLLHNPANKGKFALMHGDTVADLFPDFESCLLAGHTRFGLGKFLVMEVTDTPEVHYFSRNVPCPS